MCGDLLKDWVIKLHFFFHIMELAQQLQWMKHSCMQHLPFYAYSLVIHFQQLYNVKIGPCCHNYMGFTPWSSCIQARRGEVSCPGSHNYLVSGRSRTRLRPIQSPYTYDTIKHESTALLNFHLPTQFSASKQLSHDQNSSSRTFTYLFLWRQVKQELDQGKALYWPRIIGKLGTNRVTLWHGGAMEDTK